MKHPAKRLFAAALVASLFAGANARADFVNWTYNFTPSSSEIFADIPSAGKITLSNEPAGSATGDSYIVASNIKTVSDSDPKSPAVFTDKFYSLTLTINDTASGKSDSLVFSGKFNGLLSAKSAIVSNEFLGSTLQSVTIGSNMYTVKIGPFAPPGPPTATNSGSISALANVTVKEVPEPSTLALAGMCLAVIGGGWWCRRARGRNLALDLA